MNSFRRIGMPILVVAAVLIAVMQILLVPSSQLDNIAEIA